MASPAATLPTRRPESSDSELSDDKKDQRKHAPSAKRIREFRKRGEIALSKDLTTTVAMTTGVLAVFVFAGNSYQAIKGVMHRSFFALSNEITADVFDGTIGAMVVACAPAALGTLLGWLIASAAQIGVPPVLKPLKFDPFKVFNPASVANILSPKQIAWRTLQSVAKVTAVGLLAAWVVASEFDAYMASPAVEPGAMFVRLGEGCLRLILSAGAMLFLLALTDWSYQKRQLMSRMKMTDEELKREHKDQEGDPQIKGKRRRKAREMAERRLAQAVQTADVVVVNPTHYSVAIRYRSEESNAPRVVAKGKDDVAARIRTLAREAGVPILSRPPLTRLLYKLVPEGKEIPGELYNAVAEILAYIYRLKKQGAGAR